METIPFVGAAEELDTSENQRILSTEVQSSLKEVFNVSTDVLLQENSLEILSIVITTEELDTSESQNIISPELQSSLKEVFNVSTDVLF